MEGSVVVVPNVANSTKVVADHKRNSSAESVEHALTTWREGTALHSVGLDGSLLHTRWKVLEWSVADIAVVTVVWAILIVISELEAVDVVHELHSNVVSEEDNVVASSSVSTEISLGSLTDAGVANKRRPDQAMNSLIPEHSPESSIVQGGEETHHSLVVMLADFLGDETSLMLVVNGQTSIHVDLINEGRSLQEGKLRGLLSRGLENPSTS
mmetsp:Transcript_37068/g.116657  ORF Transcript_37068/g.116657 Transcript_37068/m.116657 type:complete len:212 (-) Transcript_37068:1029-1664(-)